MRYMLDTNILIHILKNKSDKLIKKLVALSPDDVCISVITYSELTYGVEHSELRDRNKIALILLLANIEIIEFDSMDGDAYGKVMASLENKGTPIGSMDLLIVAHALSRDCILVTNNTREFKRVDGLTVEDWV